MYRIRKLLAAASIGGLLGYNEHSSTELNPSILRNVTSKLSGFTTSIEPLLFAANAKSLPNSNVVTNNLSTDERQQRLQKRAGIMKYGYPTLDNIIQYEDHVLAYSNIHKAPLWVCEHLASYNVDKKDETVTRVQSKFRPDESVYPVFRSQNKDYLNSGYDRGHLAAAANHKQSQTAMNDTFFLSNICPQTGKGLNRSKWNNLEKRGRTLARKHSSVHVLTGPLYLPTVIGNEKFVKYKLIGDNNVAVPTHFYKAIVAQSSKGGYHLECYVMPNEEIRDDVPISSFLVPKYAIEKGAGYFVFEFIADSQYKTINGLPNPDFIQ